MAPFRISRGANPNDCFWSKCAHKFFWGRGSSVSRGVISCHFMSSPRYPFPLPLPGPPVECEPPASGHRVDCCTTRRRRPHRPRRHTVPWGGSRLVDMCKSSLAHTWLKAHAGCKKLAAPQLGQEGANICNPIPRAGMNLAPVTI